MYVAIEGIDTAGKSTQIDFLKKVYSDGFFTKEPNSNKIRNFILNEGLNSSRAELLMFLADRAEHVENNIKPNRDRDIFSDRSLISGISYALVRDSLDFDFLVKLNIFATETIFPDRAVLLWLDFDELENRLNQKNTDKIELRGIEYLFDIQSRMLETIHKLDIEHTIINAKESKEEIHSRILNFLKN